ncbi:LacI family DNA-binding transcriptional regulator [Arachnia propionica]|uniref:LacI family transcriptional regulator n=1 Tax=Arachnia propionica TaxID=1750 RepID=A0A3P1WUA8_9ACTN|nr:LacI family DNA-binding transcriptional regulator [Arachnia propionica]RRD50232.1 LacI family transcriptional regulator [Arachnia propionica]
MTGRSRVRAADVAAAAGVSQTAVSFVLNGRDAGNISPVTRQRVLQAAEELGYRPNHVARSLRQRSTSSIGLVTDGVASSPFGGRLLAAATETADAADHVLLVMDLDHRTGRVDDAIADLEHRQVDAVIYATMGFTQLGEAPASRIPLVLANCTSPDPGTSSVSPDDAGGAVAALEHLAGLGHREIVMLGGHHDPTLPEAEAGNVSGPIRWEAFRQAAAERDIAARLHTRGWEINDGHAAALDVLDVPAGERPTALFAVCDRVATGALLAAAKLGLDVPGDLSVIGFDDQETLAERLVPALTTVALPHAAMGEAAVRLALDTSTPAEQLVLPCPLVIRNSTAPPRPER